MQLGFQTTPNLSAHSILQSLSVVK
jgi:hypothetical protein